MTRPLDDVYARARLIWAEAIRRNEAGEHTFHAASAEVEADTDHTWTGDDRHMQDRADNWTERETS